MIILDATTKTIKVNMTGAAATTNPDFAVAYADNTGSAFTEGALDGALNGVTDVTVVSAPAASTRRIIKDIRIENRDTASVTLNIKYDNNATQRTLARVTLEIGDTWTLAGAYSTNGGLKSTAVTAGDTLTTEGALINSATSKTTPVDADYVGLMDSAASNILKKLSWANIKATFLGTINTWTKTQSATVTALTSSAASIAVDLSLSNNYSHTMTENTTLAAPSNAVAGTSGQIAFTQHASAAKTLAYNAAWISTDGTTPALSTTVGTVNVLTYYIVDSTHVWFALSKHGVT